MTVDDIIKIIVDEIHDCALWSSEQIGSDGCLAVDGDVPVVQIAAKIIEKLINS